MRSAAFHAEARTGDPGDPPLDPLVADLADCYRHGVRRAPAFTLVSGGSEAGVYDAARPTG